MKKITEDTRAYLKGLVKSIDNEITNRDYLDVSYIISKLEKIEKEILSDRV
jgi:hypothetical protein